MIFLTCSMKISICREYSLSSAQYISHKDIGSISGAISCPREPHNAQGFHVETYAEYMYNNY